MEIITKRGLRRIKGNSRGQVAFEFTFCFIALLVLIYGAITLFKWSGMSLAVGGRSHGAVLFEPVIENWESFEEGPLRQVVPEFYELQKLNLVY